MTFTDYLLIAVALGVAYAIVAHLPQIKAALARFAEDAKAWEGGTQRLVQDAENRITALLHVHHASVTAKIAALPQTPTVTFDGSPDSPAWTVTTPVAVPTVNGVPVPDGISYADFGQLVVAVQGAKAMFPILDTKAAWFNAGWFGALGLYFREALLHYATGDVLAALQAFPANILSVTADQWNAAEQAVGAVAPVSGT